jgi:uncharacterized membrane protein YcjF (UPF0283 family)
MCMRALAVASLILLLVIASTGAEDVKIMGLTETHAARADSQRPLAYLTGSCQKKHRRMTCPLNEIAVNKVDPTPLADKAKAVMEQVKQDPHSVENMASITASATFGHSASPDNVTCWYIITLQ